VEASLDLLATVCRGAFVFELTHDLNSPTMVQSSLRHRQVALTSALLLA
jgi:hypothetical protein